MENRSSGFTVIELVVVIAVLLAASLLFFNQKNTIEAASRDNQRKANINTIYHNLEKIYYAKNQAYPKEVNETTLPAVPADTFKDPNGILINGSVASNLGLTTTYSTYHYDPTGCVGATCKSYTLRAELENEADYTKTSVHKGTVTDKKD